MWINLEIWQNPLRWNSIKSLQSFFGAILSNSNQTKIQARYRVELSSKHYSKTTQV